MTSRVMRTRSAVILSRSTSGSAVHRCFGAMLMGEAMGRGHQGRNGRGRQARARDVRVRGDIDRALRDSELEAVAREHQEEAVLVGRPRGVSGDLEAAPEERVRRVDDHNLIRGVGG
jgi:hypothetical protein